MNAENILRMRSVGVIIIFCFALDCHAQKKIWGERLAETVMKTHADSIVVGKYISQSTLNEKTEKGQPANWNYEVGVVLKGFDELWKATHNDLYFNYMKKIMDSFILDDGSIRTYDLLEYNLDQVTPGRIVLSLYQKTKQEKYKKAAYQLREQLVWQPRTKEGGFWHKHRYPYQMWLDGLYMAEPFYAEFAQIFNEPKDFDDIANQFIWIEKHTRDAKTGLLYHGWDESKKQKWANPVTGQSPEFWSRAMGWYAMALVDVLDYFPKDHPKQKEMLAIFQRLSLALRNYQDQSSGVWYQIIDKANAKGNYLEASASCMFTYALAKGIRKGYLDKGYTPVVRKAFDGLVKTFIQTDSDGTSHLMNSCSGAGLGGTPYRDGTYAYYIKEALRNDDLKGIGPFIEASIEVELD